MSVPGIDNIYMELFRKMRATFEKEISSPTLSFTDIMFEWSLEDISYENLYRDKVQKIPESFDSVDDYLGSYRYPLLEETRAQLLSSMEVLYRAPFAEVVEFKESKPYGSKVYQMRVNHWKNRFSERGKEPYRTLPGDFLVLADAKPETFSDLERVGRSWAFLSVNTIIDYRENEAFGSSSVQDEDFEVLYFKVKASKDFNLEFEKQSSLFVVFLTNVTTNSRIWNALHMLGNPAILNRVLCAGSVVGEISDLGSEGNMSESDGRLVKTLTSSLNESQSNAVTACLRMLNETKKAAFELIWGPPGTGKTKTTATLLVLLLKMKHRTLTCAPTNVAITEVASRVMKMVADTSAGDLFCSFGDILLFGNKSRLKFEAGAEEVFLDYRVKRLVECLGPLGLHSSIISMISFLEDCVSQYHVYLENQLIKEKEESKTKDVKSEDHKKKSFLEYTRERFVNIVEPLRECISIFCTHIPKSYILEANFQSLLSLTGLLDRLDCLLFDDNLDSKELEELFSCAEDTEDPSLVDRTSFPSVKSTCLSLLKSLHLLLRKLELPSFRDEERIAEFCFQRASLLFSTVSSSYKLHRMEIEPMSVLVIDEAAQLKECESTIPLQLPGIKHVVLVGDECQLPATVTSKVAEEAGFGRSLFERLSSLNHPKHLLNMQYRMHPSISLFPNSKFYLNQIQNASIVQRKSYEKHYLPGLMFGPYSFLNVIGGREEKDEDGHSRRNMVEAAIVLKILHRLHKAWLESQDELSIGIVSPYAAQVVLIQDKLGNKYEKFDGFRVKVKTIDGFQGGEDDIIIMSTVRSFGRSLEFISSPQRVNVSLTRARHCLWILGNESTLTTNQAIWDPLVTDAKNRGCFFNVDDDKDLAKAIVDVKKELDQFDDLLNADSVLFRSSKWEVRFSDNFLKSFKKLTSVRNKKSVLNLLLKLASGWRPKRPILASGGGSSMEISKFKVEGWYVISTVDVVKISKYTQVLRIWDVLPPDDIPKLIKRLDAIFAKYTDEFISLCNEKSLDSNLEVPKSWPPSIDITQFKDLSANETGTDLTDVASDGRSYVENSKVSESLLLMKFYSLSYPAVNHLLSDRDGQELDLPFEVTDQEMEIILFPRSTFILGRSGTGKTTVLTMKLFQKEKLHHNAIVEIHGDSEEIGRVRGNGLDQKSPTEKKAIALRQLFVTVSPKLCNAVKKHVSDLKSFACRGSNTDGSGSTETECINDEEEQFKNIPDSFHDITPNSYPLVLTFHKFLMMLDGTFSKSYFERFIDMSSVSDNRRRSSRSVALQTFLRTKEVNYDKFSVSYWPHFNSTLTKKLDPSRVFTEIISHIKGGPRAMESPDFKLSRENYVMLSEGRSSNLTAERRAAIYDIYQMYEKEKMENGEFDLADFVIDLHYRLRHERYKGDRMDFVYIDEVQDLAMSQIALFKDICSNVEDGFVFSGDTAQTIARGIDFRFQDIRTLFYKKFLLESKNEHEDRREKGIISPIFSLSQNFRTHAGILKLSQSIVELLYHFFPQSIDVLKPETSLIYGEAPVLLRCDNNENAIVKIFGNNAKDSGKIVGFGAEQVILVRDDNARQEIAGLIGKQALLLTVLECKGLEFQDVLLYNFFESSPLRNQWRVIYEYMKEQNMFDSSSPNCPKFSESKHNILCSELKQLYVAVTRTRQRLWICESTEFSEPMFDYWKKKYLVQERQLADSLAQAMQVASSPEEWRSRGIKLFYEKNFEWATVCFERAQDKYWEKMSKASGLKAMAENMRTSKPEEAKTILREAAEIFETIGKADLAARCFADLGDYERAGRIYLEKFGDSELARAAECFSLAGRYKLAADVYAKGRFSSECLNVCVKGKLFEVGLEYIKEWKQHLKKECGSSTRGEEIQKEEQVFLENCAFHYHEIQDKRSMMNFVTAFNSMDLIRNFLRPLGCFDELMSLEEEAGNFMEAVSIAKMKGNMLRVIDLLGKARKFKDAVSLILSYVLARSLWSPGKGWPLKQFKEKEELLKKAKSFAKHETENFYEFVCLEAEIMSTDKSGLAEIMNHIITSQKHQSLSGEVLSIRKILDAHFSSKPDNYSWEEVLVSDPKTNSEGTILKNHVSVESLVYFWNSWRDEIASIFEYLGCLASQDVNKYLNHGEFCLNFLGIWRQFRNSNPVYLLLSSDTDWARECSKRSKFWNSGMLVSVEVHELAASARVYWSSEVLFVGMKVLEKLEAVANFQIQKNGSQFCRSRILTFIYEVANHLLESKHLKLSNRISKTLHDFVRLATDNYVRYAIPLGCQRSVTLSMMILRGTDVSKKLLTRYIAENIGPGDISYGKIGTIAMIILGSGIVDNQIYESIKKEVKWNPPWNAFLDCLCRHGAAKEVKTESHLVWRFLEAMSDTFNVNLWKVQDYISPHCFLYLIENLLNWAASVQGYIVTTKSVFLEWLMYQDEYTKVVSSSSSTVHHLEGSLEEVRVFVVSAIKEFLYNEEGMFQWMRISSITVNYEQCSLLVTRIMVILCLLQANFGNCMGLIYYVLQRNYVAQHLPREFGDTIIRGRNRDFLRVISEAFMKIDNPLVIVNLGGKCQWASCPNTVFVDMKVNPCKDDILRTFFPKTSDCSSESSVIAAAAEPEVSCCEVPSTTDSGTEKTSEISCLDSKFSTNEHCNTTKAKERDNPIDSGSFWDILEAIHSLQDVSEHLQSYEQILKDNLEKCIAFSTDDQKLKIPTDDTEVVSQFPDMVDELKQLQSALDTSEPELASEASLVIKNLCTRLQSRRAVMEPILNQLLSQQGTDFNIHVVAAALCASSEASNGKDHGDLGDNDGVSEESKKAEACHTSVASGSGETESKHKKKQNMKNKGKKKRWRRS